MKNLQASDDGDLPTSGILGMGFMREAIKQKREAAKVEAQSVLKELEGLDAGLDADLSTTGRDAASDAEASGTEAAAAPRAEIVARRRFTAEELAQARKEVDEIIDRDDIATECTVSGPLTVRGVAAPAATASIAAAPAANVLPASAASASNQKVAAAKSLVGANTGCSWSDNPWLTEPEAYAGEGTSAASSASNPKASAASERVEASTTPKKSTKANKNSTEKTLVAGDGRCRDGNNGDECAAELATAEEVLSVLNADSQAALEQRDIVRTMFVQGTQEDDFDYELGAEEREQMEAAKKPELVGWGSWTGEGIVPRRPKGNGKGKDKQTATPNAQNMGKKRPRVQIRGDNDVATGKYFVDKVPFPFQSPAQYNQEMRMPSGPEWNTMDTHLNRIKPKVCIKAGAIVPPLQFVKHLPPEQRDSVIDAWSAAKQPKRPKARF